MPASPGPQSQCLGGTPILHDEPRQKDESGNSRVASKDATPVFPAFPVFLVLQLSPLPGFNGLTVFCQRGTKNTDYTWLSLATAYLHDLMVVYLTDDSLTTVTNRECYASWGF